MSKGSPRVSVVLPVKDAEEYLDDALTSLTRQLEDVRDLEVVMVDDGSTDRTVEVAERYVSRIPGLRVVANSESVGAATARNQGLSEARGRYVTYLDGDDWLAPGHLGRVADALDHFGCPVIRTDHTIVEDGRRSIVRAPEPVRGRVLSPRESILPVDRSTMVDYPYAWAGMYDRAIGADGLLTFSDGMQTATDRTWVWRLHLETPSYVVIDAPGVLYRRGVTTSLTQTYDLRRLDFTRAFTEIRELLESDAETDRFLPKLVRTVLAITAHHFGYVEHMDPHVRAELVRRSSALIEPFPRPMLREALAELGAERWSRLHDVLPPELARPEEDVA